MPYPHVTQFETLALRRREALLAPAPRPRLVRPPWRLMRRERPATGTPAMCR